MSRKLGNDRKLCNYEDFTIFESDFRSICSSWLTDTAGNLTFPEHFGRVIIINILFLVNFAATFVKNDLFGKSDDKVSLF